MLFGIKHKNGQLFCLTHGAISFGDHPRTSCMASSEGFCPYKPPGNYSGPSSIDLYIKDKINLWGPNEL